MLSSVLLAGYSAESNKGIRHGSSGGGAVIWVMGRLRSLRGLKDFANQKL